MKQKQLLKRGFATLTMIVLLAFIGALIVTAVSLKILVGVERTRSFSDSLQSSYAAESEINDIIERYLQYPAAAISPGTVLLADGTQLITTSTNDAEGNSIIDILAKRPFSSIKLELSKRKASKSNQNLDLILTLDCTGSMNECADPKQGDSCQSSQIPNPLKPTKFEALKTGALAFLESLESITDATMRVGVTVFTVDSNWLTTSDGHNTQIKPENNVPISVIRRTIEDKFQKLIGSSSACTLVSPSSTAVGGGVKYVNKYFSSTKDPGTKQVQVLITDGEPNSVIPDPACHEQYLKGLIVPKCPFTPQGDPKETWMCGGSNPALHSKWQLACQLADKNILLDGSYYGQPDTYGQRDPDQDSYMITIFKVRDAKVFEILNQYASEYFDMRSATDLTNILLTQVLPIIKSSIDNFTIRKVIP